MARSRRHRLLLPALTDRQWTVAEMIERTANYVKPEAKPITLADVIAHLPEGDSETTNK